MNKYSSGKVRIETLDSNQLIAINVLCIPHFKRASGFQQKRESICRRFLTWCNLNKKMTGGTDCFPMPFGKIEMSPCRVSGRS